ncbi:MAG TPA: twin-arginine translocase subunit TatC [Thermomicrobiales bacterium]
MARISARPPRLLAPLRNLNPLRPFRRGPKKAKPDADMMTLQEHLIEFRTRLVRSILAIFAGMIVGFIFAGRVFNHMLSIIHTVNPGSTVITTEATEGFMTYFKIALYIGIIVSSPILFYQIVRFMAPGLLPHELKYLLWGIPLASALFISGVLFANAVVIPSFLKFLVNFSFGFLGNFTVTSNNFLTFFIKISIGMGLIFQLPALLFLLSKIRVVNVDKLRRWRRYAFLICTIVGATISPTPDPFNMMLVAIPMYALYEVGTVTSYFALPRGERGRFWRRPKLAA